MVTIGNRFAAVGAVPAIGVVRPVAVDWIDFTQAWLEKTATGWTSISYETFSSQADLEYDVREVIGYDAAGPYGGGQAQQVPPNQTP